MTYQGYNWQNRIVDPVSGAVLQAGTKVSALRLNAMEGGISAAHGITEALARELSGGNYVSSVNGAGFVFTSTGLTAYWTAGTAYVDGVKFDVAAGSMPLNATQGQYLYVDSDGAVKKTTTQSVADGKCALWYFATNATAVLTSTDRRTILKVVSLGQDGKIGVALLPYLLDQNLRQSDSPSFIRVNFTQATGTAPMTVNSTTVVTNLNADRVDGFDFNQSLLTTASPQFAALTIAGGGGALKMTPGAADHVYLALYARTATPSTRSGFVGYGSAGGNGLVVKNEIDGGSLSLQTTGTGTIKANGQTLDDGTGGSTLGKTNKSIHKRQGVDLDIDTLSNVYTYNGNGQITKIEKKDSDGAVVKSTTYTFDGNGNVQTMTEVAGGTTVTTTFVLDGNNFITSDTKVVL